MDDDTLIISCIKPKTLMNRMNGVPSSEIEEEEEAAPEEEIVHEDY